ncbi:MAG: trypsin-like serine protease, partial [Saprospiraceae bacterium]|nr:trypsin-like serine protease [Saprospiraceae bacterium]
MKNLPCILLAICFLLLSRMLNAQTVFNGELWYRKPLPKFQALKNKNLLKVNRPFNVKLFVKQGGANWVCSGSLIDSRHVLTAGHCIFDSGWADTVFVVPAYYFDTQNNQGVAPFGDAVSVTTMLSWTGWTQQNDYE